MLTRLSLVLCLCLSSCATGSLTEVEGGRPRLLAPLAHMVVQASEAQTVPPELVELGDMALLLEEADPGSVDPGVLSLAQALAEGSLIPEELVHGARAYLEGGSAVLWLVKLAELRSSS